MLLHLKDVVTGLQILNQEFQDTERQLKQRIHDLEVQEKDKSAKLSVYERLEHELDDAIMQAAEGIVEN